MSQSMPNQELLDYQFEGYGNMLSNSMIHLDKSGTHAKCRYLYSGVSACRCITTLCILCVLISEFGKCAQAVRNAWVDP